jgi:hypothetical protein
VGGPGRITAPAAHGQPSASTSSNPVRQSAIRSPLGGNLACRPWRPAQFEYKGAPGRGPGHGSRRRQVDVFLSRGAGAHGCGHGGSGSCAHESSDFAQRPPSDVRSGLIGWRAAWGSCSNDARLSALIAAPRLGAKAGRRSLPRLQGRVPRRMGVRSPKVSLAKRPDVFVFSCCDDSEPVANAHSRHRGRTRFGAGNRFS